MISFIELNNESCQVMIDIAFIWFAYYGLICFTLQCAHYFRKHLDELQMFKGISEEPDEESEEEPEEKGVPTHNPDIIIETESDSEISEQEEEQEEEEKDEEIDFDEIDNQEDDPNYTITLSEYSLRKRRRNF